MKLEDVKIKQGHNIARKLMAKTLAAMDKTRSLLSNKTLYELENSRASAEHRLGCVCS